MNLFKKSLLSPAVALLICTNVYADNISYSIEKQSLKDAIEKISKKANKPYIADSSVFNGKTANAIKDVTGTQNALDEVLKNSGLEAVMEDGAIIIKKRIGEGTVLEPISINDGYSNGSSESGYVTKEISGVGLWDKRSLQDTPYQMSVVSQEMIENSASGIDQIFKMNPVVQVKTASTASSGSWNVPGINIRGFGASGNQILDGVPFSWLQGVMTEDVERIEVLNGLSGFLYGVGYVGGAVNYVSKKPTQERLTNLTVGTTGNEAAYAHVDLGGKIDEKGKFSYRLNALKQDGETSIKDQNIDRELISGALDWRVTDDLIFSFDASHKERRVDRLTANFNSNDAIGKLDTTQAYAPDWTFSDSSQDRLGFKSLWQINDSVKLRTAYIHLDQENEMLLPYVTDNYNGTYSFNYFRQFSKSFEEVHGAYAYIDIDFDTFGVEHTLTIGGSGNKAKTKLTGEREWLEAESGKTYTLSQLNNIGKPILSNTNSSKKLSSRSEKTNFMIGDDITFNEQWSALVGLNYAKTETSNYSRTTGNKTSGYDADEVTPSVSLIYKPFEDLTTYATYMEALEDGTVVDNYYSNAGEIFDPYISKQYEIGAKYSVSENLLLSSAIFRIEKANSYEDKSTTPSTLTQNGLVIHEGIELTATGKITDDLTIVGGGTYMDLEIDKAIDWSGTSLNGKKPTNTASKMAKLYAEYNIPFVQGLTVTGGAYYTGKSYRDEINTDVIPSYTIYDAGLRYKTKLDKYPTTFIMNITNLTNKEYWNGDNTFGDPRNIAFSMKMEF